MPEVGQFSDAVDMTEAQIEQLLVDNPAAPSAGTLLDHVHQERILSVPFDATGWPAVRSRSRDTTGR
jgi:hypothetical protein